MQPGSQSDSPHLFDANGLSFEAELRMKTYTFEIIALPYFIMIVAIYAHTHGTRTTHARRTHGTKIGLAGWNSSHLGAELKDCRLLAGAAGGRAQHL